MSVLSDTPYSKQTESLLQIILEAQACFIKAKSISQSFERVLDGLLTLTQSEHGCIGEVLYDEAGAPCLQTHAITNITWDEETRNFFAQHESNMKFTNLDNVFGQVLTSGVHVISHYPYSDPYCKELPQGIPCLNAFLGMPIYDESTLVGIAGLANRPGGYDEDLVKFLHPLLLCCGSMISANRTEQRKCLEETRLRKSEEGIHELYRITSRHYSCWEEQMAALLELGCHRFNLPVGVLTKLQDGFLRFEYVSAPHNEVSVGLEFPADQIFCGHTLKTLQPLSFEHAGSTEWRNHPGHNILGWEAYIGATVFVGSQPYGTLAFVSQEPVHEKFTDTERDFVQFMAQWVGKELARRQSDDSHRESEAKLQTILDASTSVIYVKDLDGKYLFINQQYEALFNVKREEIQFKTDYDLFAPHLAKEFRFNDQMVQNCQRSLVIEEVAPHSDGFHTYLSNKFPLFTPDGGLYATCGISTDITDRKRAELDLRESESRFRTMADTAPVLIWISDVEKKCTFVNQGWLDFTGRTVEQELGNGWTDNIHPDDSLRCLSIWQDAFEHRTLLEMEFRLRHHDGEYRWMLDRGVPRFDPDGTFLGYIGTCLDISQQKDFEQSIQHYNQLLQKEVKERTIRIQELEQRRMQVEKLAALSQIAAGVAHEINNPLASIQQSLHLVKRIVPTDHPRAKYVPKIEKEIHRIAQIIKQMYQLYQPRHAYPRLINVNHVAKEASDLIASLHKNENRQVHLELSQEMMDLPLPATELHQVICNLLQNAFDAVLDAGKIVLRTGIETGAAWIQVQDNGPGMTPEVLSHVFEPFYSTKVNMKRNGMGLGLSVSRSLVEAMGGNIQGESIVGKGTTFTVSFSLPIVPNFPSHLEERGSSFLAPMDSLATNDSS